MKNKTKCFSLILLVFCFIFALTGCSLLDYAKNEYIKEKTKDIEGIYDIVIEGNRDFPLGEEFDVLNIKLRTLYHDNTYEIIDLTEDMMVEYPDINILGYQYFIVEYNEKEYKIYIKMYLPENNDDEIE